MFHSGKIRLCLSTFPSIHRRKCHLYFFGKVALGQEAPLPDSLDFFRKTHVASPLHPCANNIALLYHIVRNCSSRKFPNRFRKNGEKEEERRTVSSLSPGREISNLPWCSGIGSCWYFVGTIKVKSSRKPYISRALATSLLTAVANE